jgi:transposase-like protein
MSRAYEPNLDACLMMHLSNERTILVCCLFFKQLRKGYSARRLNFINDAGWYIDACKWLRLTHRVCGTELKNLV